MANPNPSPETRFKKGQSGNPGGRAKRPDIEALDKLIAELDAEPGIAKTWLAEALGNKETIIETEHPDGTITRKIKRERIPANVPLLKLLIEYRNGKVPQQVDITERKLTVDRRDKRKPERTGHQPAEPPPDAESGEG